MPRCGQMSRSAKTLPALVRPISTGSPSRVLWVMAPGRSPAPGSATYHSPRRSSALRSCMPVTPASAGRAVGLPEGAVASGGGRQRSLCLLDDRLKRRRLADREVGQHLAVDQQPGLAEAVDEPAVGKAERAHRRIEPLDPERAEGALAALAVAIGILVRLLDRLLGDANGVLAPAVIAFGGFEDFLVLGVSGDAALDACHG